MRWDLSACSCLGVLTGPVLAAPALDVPLTDVYFVVAARGWKCNPRSLLQSELGRVAPTGGCLPSL